MKNSFQHIPVMLEEVATNIIRNPGNETRNNATLILDGTLGGAGHSGEILRRLESAFLIGLDRDEGPVERARIVLQQFAERTEFLVGTYAEADTLFDRLPTRFRAALQSKHPGVFRPITPSGERAFCFDGIVLDLGISSDQLGDSTRGFSFSQDGPLDMRMNLRQELSAAAVLNEYTAPELRRVFQIGGLRVGASQLADAVCRNRPLHTTQEFAKLCEAVLGGIIAKKRERHGSSQHAATVPFQAVRIEVNDEYGTLERFFSILPLILAPGGRLVIISFHSLEDKLVTQHMRQLSRQATVLRRLPVSQEEGIFGSILTKEALRPTAEEVRRNPRSRSARMRVFERSLQIGTFVGGEQ